MTIFYDSGNHWEVITAWRGTVWNGVLPFCVANMMLSALVDTLNYLFDFQFGETYDTGMTPPGVFIFTLIVAFLVVARVSTTYGRFWEARTLVSRLLRQGEQLATLCATFTGGDISQGAMEWRAQMSELLIQFISISSSIICEIDNVVDLSSKAGTSSSVDTMATKSSTPSLLDRNNDRDTGTPQKSSKDSYDSENAAEMLLNELEIPTDLMRKVVTLINQQKFMLNKSLMIQSEIKLHQLASNILRDYYELSKFSNTPFPFPLVQMARLIIGIWLMLVPFYMTFQTDNIAGYFVKYSSIFFITYGFLGLEMVSIELDDPFGDDLNDIEMAKLSRKTCVNVFNILRGNTLRYYQEFEEAHYLTWRKPSEEDRRLALNYRESGKEQFSIGNHEMALKYLRRSIKCDAYTFDAANALALIGKIYGLMSMPEDSLKNYQEAMLILNGMDSKGESNDLVASTKAIVLGGLGCALFELGDITQALPLLLKSHELLKSSDEILWYDDDVIAVHHKLAVIYFQKQEGGKALEYFLYELKARRRRYKGYGNQEMASLLVFIGQCYEMKGDFTWSLSYYKQAKNLCDDINANDIGLKIAIIVRIGLAYLKMEDCDNALESFEEALQIDTRENGEKLSISPVDILDHIAETYNKAGKIEEVISTYEVMLEILFKERPMDRDRVGVTLTKLGTIYRSLNERDKALEYFEDSLRHMLLSSQGLNDVEVQLGYKNLGLAYFSAGKFELAAHNFNKSLIMNQKRLGGGYDEEAGFLLMHQGRSCIANRTCAEGINFLQKALKIIRNISPLCDKMLLPTILYSLGRAYFEEKDYLSSLECFEEALILYQNFEDVQPYSIADTLENIGNIHVLMDNKELAIIHYINVVEFYRQRNGDKLVVARLFSKIGSIHVKSNQKKSAIYYYEKSIESISAIGSKTGELGRLHVKIGEIYESLQEIENAISSFTDALQCKNISSDDREKAKANLQRLNSHR